MADEFDTSARPTLIASVLYGTRRYLPGDEKDFARDFGAQGMAAVPDMIRLTELGVISGFERVVARLEAGQSPFEEEKASAAPDSSVEQITLPSVSKLAEFLQSYTDADTVRQIAAQDVRATAAPIYEARIAELS